MSFPLFFSIPSDVMLGRIMPFFDAVSLVRLDSAVQAKDLRSHLLENILHNATLDCEVSYAPDLTRWLIKRHVSVTTLRFPPDTEPSDVELSTSILSKAKFVDMDGCNSLTSESVQNMLRNCGSKALTGLGCENCEWLNDETLKVLADHHHQSLTVFFLSKSSNVTDAGAAYVLNQCQGLSQVQWADCEQVGELAVAALANHSIETFFALNCPAIPEASIVTFLQNNNDCLRSLTLVNNQEATDQTLLALARRCPSLDSLVINDSEGSDAGLCALIKACQKLNELSANHCNVTPKVLDCMGKHLSPTLTALSIVGCAPFKTKHISAITSRVPMLKILSIDSNEGLNNDTLKAIGAHCVHLESLSVQMNPEISLPGIKALVKNCPQLDELTFKMCSNLCDKCLIAIAKNCPNLRQLHVPDNPTITDHGIGAIAKYCPKLEYIDLGHTNISERAVVHLMNCCPALRTVELQGREEALSQALVDAAEKFEVTLITEEDYEESDDSDGEHSDSDGSEDDGISEDGEDSEGDDQE